MDMNAKKTAIKFQVAAEAGERCNQLFLEQTRTWLHSEDVDPEMRDLFLQRLENLVNDVSKLNRFAKRQMDADAQIAA